MLFDLRSRGRRRTVQVIYLFLALIMVGGLVLVGVGTGNGNGGLLNAFTNNGSGGGTNASDQATKAALKATRQHPSSPAAWASLVQARFELANQGSNYNTATSTYTASGKKQLRQVATAYQRYTSLTQSPSVQVARLAAEAYVSLSQWSGAAGAWETVAGAEPSANSFICLAATSYAAKQTRKGQLAAAQAIKLAPKLQQLQLKQALSAAKTQSSAAQLAQQDC